MRGILVVLGTIGSWSFALVGCPKPTPPVEPPITVFPAYDAGEEPELCELACESLAKMGCPESSPAGKTCTEVCKAAVDAGFPLNTLCVANASTPEQARGCGHVRCEGR